MNSKANPALIGGFILGALALMITVVVLFASGYFSHSLKSIIYFDGSVNGLNVGALVKLKGVAVGKVTDILVVFDEEHSKIITPVVVEFEREKILDANGRQLTGTGRQEIKKLVEQGLRAQLQMQSLVTGQLFVDINFRPNTPVRMMGGETPKYPEIPSVPSSREQLESTVEEVINQVKKIPLQDIIRSLQNTVLALEKIINSPHILASLETLDKTLKDVNLMVQHLDSKINPLTDGLQGTVSEGKNLLTNLNKQSVPTLTTAQETLKAATAAMNQASATLTTVNQAASPNSNLDLALRDLSTAAKSLRILADYLERHPDALLYGKKPSGN